MDSEQDAVSFYPGELMELLFAYKDTLQLLGKELIHIKGTHALDEKLWIDENVKEHWDSVAEHYMKLAILETEMITGLQVDAFRDRMDEEIKRLLDTGERG